MLGVMNNKENGKTQRDHNKRKNRPKLATIIERVQMTTVLNPVIGGESRKRQANTQHVDDNGRDDEDQGSAVAGHDDAGGEWLGDPLVTILPRMARDGGWDGRPKTDQPSVFDPGGGIGEGLVEWRFTDF